jgi:nucleoside diphosphate kinase
MEANESMEDQKTYAMIKPDAVAAGASERIMQLIESNGFTIVQQAKLQVGESGTLQLYQEGVSSDLFNCIFVLEP